MSNSPRLEDAIALLRIARDAFHIDENMTLSKARISLNDLCGEPEKQEPSTQRSLSVFMLCNQSFETVLNIGKG